MNLISKFAQIANENDINLPMQGSGESQLESILSVTFMIAAGIAVIVVIVGGLSYVLSNGDPQKAAKAKDTILYAVIGLAVAVLATTVVGFVFNRL